MSDKNAINKLPVYAEGPDLIYPLPILVRAGQHVVHIDNGVGRPICGTTGSGFVPGRENDGSHHRYVCVKCRKCYGANDQ